jgi:hypothetical protein
MKGGEHTHGSKKEGKEKGHQKDGKKEVIKEAKLIHVFTRKILPSMF